jgi:hypothetical protein
VDVVALLEEAEPIMAVRTSAVGALRRHRRTAVARLDSQPPHRSPPVAVISMISMMIFRSERDRYWERAGHDV